jgi:hypothetical protein
VWPVSLQAGAPSLRQSAFDSVPRLARVTGIGRRSGFPGLLNEKQEAFKLEVCGLQVPPLCHGHLGWRALQARRGRLGLPAGAFLLASESDSDRLTSTSGRASGALRLMWLYSGSTLGRVV